MSADLTDCLDILDCFVWSARLPGVRTVTLDDIRRHCDGDTVVSRRVVVECPDAAIAVESGIFYATETANKYDLFKLYFRVIAPRDQKQYENKLAYLVRPRIYKNGDDTVKRMFIDLARANAVIDSAFKEVESERDILRLQKTILARIRQITDSAGYILADDSYQDVFTGDITPEDDDMMDFPKQFQEIFEEDLQYKLDELGLKSINLPGSDRRPYVGVLIIRTIPFSVMIYSTGREGKRDTVTVEVSSSQCDHLCKKTLVQEDGESPMQLESRGIRLAISAYERIKSGERPREVLD